MDTLSTSVSAFPIPGLHSKPHDLLCHLRIKTTSTQQTDTSSNPHNLLSTSRRQSSSSILKQPISPVTQRSHRRLSTTTPSKQENIFHQKAASGYAAALIDIARCNNVLEPIEKDVRRFSRLLNQKQVSTILGASDVDEEEKGEILKEVAVKGKFHKHLVVLVKLIVGKNRVAILDEVFQEFQRIYDSLRNTEFVMVSSRRKMEKEEMFTIAKRVQKLRHVVNEKLSYPSFAM